MGSDVRAWTQTAWIQHAITRSPTQEVNYMGMLPHRHAWPDPMPQCWLVNEAIQHCLKSPLLHEILTRVISMTRLPARTETILQYDFGINGIYQNVVFLFDSDH